MKITEVRITEQRRAELVDGTLDAKVGPGDLLIRTEHSGVSSGTELAVYTGLHQWIADPNYPDWAFPFPAGYSACGVIEEIGDGVSSFSVGQRVVIPGKHRSHAIHPAVAVEPTDGCWLVPDGVPSEVAAFGCIIRYGWGAAARVGTTMGRSVFVQGLGIVGQGAVRAFAAAGAYPVIGLDPMANRRDTALSGGATACLDPTDGGFADTASKLLGGEPLADIVADASGAPAGVVQAMSLTQEGGQCVIVGSPRGLADAVNFYPDLHKRCIEVIGAHGDYLWWNLGARLGWDVDKAMNWILCQFGTGRMVAGDVPTATFAPSEAQSVYDMLLNDKDRIVSAAFDWSRD